MTKWSIISSSKLASKQTQKSSLTTGLKKEQHEHDGRKSGIVSETHGTEELSLHNSSSVHSSPKITKRTNEILTRNSPSGGFSQGYDVDDRNLYDYEGAVVNSMQSCLVEGRHALRWEIHDNILNCIGQTPIIKLNRIPGLTKGVNIFVKCENLNPGGSLKDRLAVGIIEWAEKHGKLQPGQTVIEASSGNTGIGLAMVCAIKGYPFVCVMSEVFSVERRKLMRYLGARVILTEKKHKSTGMLIKAQELAKKHNFFYAGQFENEANAWIHEQTTGPEIVKAFKKKNEHLDHFFMAYGTGGTMLGVSRVLRKHMPNTQIHLCEPANSPMVHSGIPTKYPENGIPSPSFDTAHPIWSPHLFQGWATDFIPKLTSMIKAENGYDEIEHVAGRDGIRVARELAQTEGIMVGISGGGILSAALKFAESCQPGTNILAMLTDTGERYMSTDLFADIPVDMTEEEQLLSDSTPSTAPPPPPHLHGIFPESTDELFDM